MTYPLPHLDQQRSAATGKRSAPEEIRGKERQEKEKKKAGGLSGGGVVVQCVVLV